MKPHTNCNAQQGFSLIEVLIAVVILSFGLLALAALQLGLIRSSSESKAQTMAMALAKERIENLESYQSVGGSDSTCISPYAGTANTCYRAIDGATEPTISMGGINFTRSFTVTRYVYDKGPGTFVLRGSTALDSAIKAASATAVPGKEFKRIVVTTAWTDASGKSTDVQVEDAISSISPADSLPVAKSSTGSTPRKAVAIITNPTSVAGVIPIAIGNGTDTAATNPRPVIVGQGSNSTAVETRFDIYTYAALNDTSAQALSRIETAVAGCKCSMGTGTQAGLRPTYWDGTRYVVPTQVSTMPVSTPVTSGVTQSELCTVCCRDHHDPSGVTGERYDPRRGAHNHYLASNLTTPVTSGVYDEACRAIRVDGVFRIAAEPYDDNFGLLATAGLNGSTPTTTITNAVPSTGTGSVTEQYQTFVLNYLAARFVDSTAYNTVTDPTTVTGYGVLQNPSTAYISTSPNTSPQYMHARGLFIDYLGASAIAAITKAKADCVTNSCTTAQLKTAVLKVLPFTSINLSELGTWSSSAATKVDVSDYGFKTTINDPLPVKGKATVANGASSGNQANGISTIQRSSAGLAVTNKVFPDSELVNNILTDQQLFEIGGSVVGGPGDQFSVALNGTALLATLTLANPADITYTLTTAQTCNKNASTITPYTCTPASGSTALPASIPVTVGNYNRQFSTTTGVSVQNSCSNSLNDTTIMPYRTKFDVTSASLSPSGSALYGASVNDGVAGSVAAGGEYTVITASPVANGSTLTVGFGNAVYLCPSNWATYITGTGDDGTLAPTNAQCGGSNNNGSPAWSTTYAPCPGTPLQ